MYICICKAITESQIRSAVESGADSIRAIRDSLGAMTQCGKCACQTRDIIRDSQQGDDSSLFYCPE